ncbi:MAG: hypothetical protein KGJ80_09845, partial [Chloroflexota bacterium]|nr:hypothetical protein [Chloroflexota bacterium]
MGETGTKSAESDHQVNIEYDDKGRRKTWRVQLNDVVTYKNTGNKYKIVGTLAVEFKYGDTGQVVDTPATYQLAITGGVFGQSPQMCQK